MYRIILGVVLLLTISSVRAQEQKSEPVKEAAPDL